MTAPAFLAPFVSSVFGRVTFSVPELLALALIFLPGIYVSFELLVAAIKQYPKKSPAERYVTPPPC